MFSMIRYQMDATRCGYFHESSVGIRAEFQPAKSSCGIGDVRRCGVAAVLALASAGNDPLVARAHKPRDEECADVTGPADYDKSHWS